MTAESASSARAGEHIATADYWIMRGNGESRRIVQQVGTSQIRPLTLEPSSLVIQNRVSTFNRDIGLHWTLPTSFPWLTHHSFMMIQVYSSPT